VKLAEAESLVLGRVHILTSWGFAKKMVDFNGIKKAKLSLRAKRSNLIQLPFRLLRRPPQADFSQ
jgi:hypothetical protein